MNWAELTSLTLVAGVILAALAAWVWYAQQRLKGQTLLAYAERRPVPWGIFDIVAVIVITVVVQLVGLGIWEQLGGSPAAIDTASAATMMVFSLSSLAIWALSITWICWRTGATIGDLGASKPHDADIRQGVVAFCLLLLPVFGVQLVLSKLWQESQHPLINLLKEDPNGATFLASAFAAVLVAPIVEEYFFRVVLQGWLENVSCLLHLRQNEQRGSQSLANLIFLGGRSANNEAIVESPSNELEASDEAEPESLIANLYSSSALPAVESSQGDDIVTSRDALPMRPAWWPVVVSAAVFALAHFGNGPDPVPLFILALGLGYLYRQTHRVWPCIVVHMLLNGMSMAQLWLFTHS